MLRKYTSTETIRDSKDKENKNRRSVSCSPYSKHYKTNLTHDQRELLSHRQHVKKLQRCELEDRYLDLLDENFAIKRENLSNHDNIRKLITKILRLSSESKIRLNSAASKQNLSSDEDLQIRIIDLESHNAQLKEKLGYFLKSHQPTSKRSSSATLRGSSTNLLKKVFHSQDNLQYHSGENIISPHQDFSNDLKKLPHNLSKPSDTIPEHSEPSSLIVAIPCNYEEKEIKELKEIIEALQKELSLEKNQSKEIVNNQLILEEKYNKQVVARQSTENIEMKNMRKELMRYEKEISKLNVEYNKLKENHEVNVEAEHSRIFELTAVLEREISKNKELIKQKECLETQVDSMDLLKQETTVIQAENELLKQHRSNISSLATELALRNETITRLLRTNEDLHKSLVEAKVNLSAFEECQQEMIRKIQSLQDQNDELIVQIQGLKAETECLYERIAMLELENQQLKQDNKNDS